MLSSREVGSLIACEGGASIAFWRGCTVRCGFSAITKEVPRMELGRMELLDKRAPASREDLELSGWLLRFAGDA